MYMNLIEVCSTQSCFTVTYQKNHERGGCILYINAYYIHQITVLFFIQMCFVFLVIVIDTRIAGKNANFRMNFIGENMIFFSFVS